MYVLVLYITHIYYYRHENKNNNTNNNDGNDIVITGESFRHQDIVGHHRAFLSVILVPVEVKVYMADFSN